MASGMTCPECGTTLPANVLSGLCPACLLKQGAAADTEAPAFQAPSVEEVRRLFPQLEIIALIGKGGMGAVYRARQPALDRVVALKLLPSPGPEGFAERFNREARALAKLNHPNIVAVHDFGQANGWPFFVMEFVDGLNLRELQQAGRISPREALQIVPQICAALQFAHDEGIVHRDIKPENILLDKKGRVKIADFGIAKIIGREPGVSITETAQAIGTPHYMAPEQVEKPETVDHRADIYSLGVVFYEMLTGELPLGKFAPPSRKVAVDVRLDEVVLHALEKEPERRYQQVSQVKTDVETIGATPEQGPTHIHGKDMNTSMSKPLWYKFALRLIAVVLGLALLAAGLVVTSYFLARERGNPAQLTQEGWQLWQSRQLESAIAKFEKAVRLEPDNANAWNGLGWASLNSSKAPQAERAFQKVIALQPNHPAALNGLGQLYLGQGKYDLAEGYLRQASPQAPAAWFGLARLYLLQGKFEEAEKWARRIIDSGQGDDFARKMLEAAQAKQLSDGVRFMIQPASTN